MLHPLLEARRLGLAVPATLLVKAYLDAHGVTPKGIIARVLEVSVRTIERALSELSKLGLSYDLFSTSMSHDHANQLQELKGASTTSSTSGDTPDDSLEGRLTAYGVLPWCVAIVLRDVPRDVVEQQLNYHAFRLAQGFVERTPGGAAKMLFRACLANFGAPKGFFVAPAQALATCEPTVTAPSVATPEPYREVVMTLDGARSAVRIGINSKIPALRSHALQIAARFNIDPHTLKVG